MPADEPNLSGGAAPPSRARPWLPALRTAGIVVLTAASSLIAVYLAAAEARASGNLTPGLHVMSAVVGLVLAGALVWRRRFAVALCLIASAGALVLPISPAAALLSLPSVVATAQVRAIAICILATGAGTTATLARDALREPARMLLAAADHQAGFATSHPGPTAYVVAGVALVGIAIAVGFAGRSRTDAAHAQEERDAQAGAAAVLRDRMTRQEERELIAREVHDTVAHHIAAISLHASALESTHRDEPDVQETAREVRASAQQAIAELRTLVTTLRSGASDGPGLPGTGLADVGALLEAWRRDGVPLSTDIVIIGADAISRRLGHAAFRIVQEAVTNAHKHAPGRPVDVVLHASPADGVTIRVTNPLPRDQQLNGDAAPPDVGTGNGLLGMRERAATLGGTVDAEIRDSRFEVRAQLPWIAAGVGTPPPRH